jgi:hypothetical protein
MTSGAHRSGADALLPLLQRRVLLVGSKGVGRVLRGCAGLPARQPLDNAELIELRFAARPPA